MFLTFKTIVGAVLLYVLHSTQADAYESRPLPPHLQSCVKEAIEGMLALTGTDEETKFRFFLDNIATDLFGRYGYGGNTWKHAPPHWKMAALRNSFDYMKGESEKLTAGMKDPKKTIIESRLADNPKTDESKGLWHVIARVTLDNGKSFAAAVLMTNACKAFDLGKDVWLSSVTRKQLGLVDARARNSR